METKSTSERTGTGKDAPIGAIVDKVPVKKRVEKPAAKAPIRPAKKKSAKSGKALVSDPFASKIDVVSPVRKASVAGVRLPAKTAKKAGADAEETPQQPATKPVKGRSLDITAGMASPAPKLELSPTFQTLAQPFLPELKRENRARLQMQTPTRLYFYWSAKENPWALLRNAFGSETGSYSLVLKLTNLLQETEETFPAEPEGNYWFDVEPGAKYQAEIGFYAPNRPYFRVIYSNTVETPRRSPSPHVATEADWTVSANKFAEVLDVAGFSRDALDVVMAGDDAAAAENVTYSAFSQFLGTHDYETRGVAAEDIRYAMLALASGAKLEDLRWRISSALLAILQANEENLEPAKAMGALTEYFDIDEAEYDDEQFGPAVYGASLMNFPRTLKTRGLSPKPGSGYSPVSSHSLR